MKGERQGQVGTVSLICQDMGVVRTIFCMVQFEDSLEQMYASELDIAADERVQTIRKDKAFWDDVHARSSAFFATPEGAEFRKQRRARHEEMRIRRDPAYMEYHPDG